MKNKTKGLIALIAMTAATAVAAGSSTFAWFQTNRSANLSFNKITITKRGSNELVAKLIKLGNGTLSENDTKLDIVAPTKAETTDISSKDALQLYAPVWNNKVGDSAKVADVETVIDSANSKADSYFTEFAFEVTNKRQTGSTDTTKLNVFLDDKTVLEAVQAEGIDDARELIDDYENNPSTTHTESEYNDALEVVAQQDKNDAAAKWSRVSIINVSEKPGSHGAVGLGKLSQSHVMTFENICSDTDDAYNEFIADATHTNGALSISTNWGTTRHYVNGVANNYFVNPENYVDSISNKTVDQINALETPVKNGLLTQLTPNQTKYYVVRVWLEGTENDNQEAADGGEVKVDLSLSSYVGA